MASGLAVEPIAPSDVSAEPRRQDAQRSAVWSAATRFVFRVSLIFFGIIAAGELLRFLPGGNAPATALANAQTAIGNWMIVNVLGLPEHSSRRGIEPLSPFVFEVVLALGAVIGAVAWSLIDRRERAYERLFAWLHALVRFALAAVMLEYGWAKIFPVQFGFGVSLSEIMQTVGELRPQRLLWVFMAASRPYAFFGGLLEVVGALLLLCRATATAGSLMLMAVLANVVVLNFAYDVNVRVYSSTLLLMAVFIAARDLPRVVRAVLGLAAPVRSALAPLSTGARWNRALQIGAAAMSVWLFYRTLSPGVRAYQRYAPAVHRVDRPVLDGLFAVEEFSRPGAADSLRWTRVAFVPEGVGAWVRFASNIDVPYGVQRDESSNTVVLRSSYPVQESLELTFTPSDSSIVILRGRAGADSVSMRLRRVHSSTFRLLQPTAFWSW